MGYGPYFLQYCMLSMPWRIPGYLFLLLDLVYTSGEHYVVSCCPCGFLSYLGIPPGLYRDTVEFCDVEVCLLGFLIKCIGAHDRPV